MRPQKLLHSFLLFAFAFSHFAQANTDTVKPFPPFHIAGNLYFVGNDFQASYLVVTPEGNILINSDYERHVPWIKKSVEQLGFKFSDIKTLLISHAHSDHAGGSAQIKNETGAQYMVMDADVPVIESGGRRDFHFGTDLTQRYPPTKVDRVLHDGDEVKLGDTILVAHITPGHTKGNTTWTMKVVEQGKMLDVAILGSVTMNPGYELVHNKTYPTIARDYQQTFDKLKSLPCDLFLGSHGMYFDLPEKYAAMKAGKANPFIDSAGYQRYIRLKEQEFQTELAKQMKVK